MKPVLVYTLWRIALFIVCYAVIGLALSLFMSGGHAFIWAIVGGAVVSSLLSLKYLNGPREEMARRLEARIEGARGRFEDFKSREDVD